MVGDFVNNKEYTVPLRNWLKKKRVKLICSVRGTSLDAEYKGKFREILAEYYRDGIAVKIPAEEVTESLDNLKIPIRSNDAYIIALAKVSGAKLLASNDEKLGNDFKKYIDGKIYKRGHRKSLQSLLDKNTCPL